MPSVVFISNDCRMWDTVTNHSQPAVLACPSLSLKAIWSRSLKSAEDTAKLIPGEGQSVDLYSTQSGESRSYDDLLKRSDISAVIVALSIMDQPGYIEKALAAGKHVLAEKPIAPDVASAQKLIAYYHKVAAETKATFSVAENFRFQDAWAYGAEEIKKLGKVTGFVVRMNGNMSPDVKWIAKSGWRAKPQHQGGFLLDGGVHFTAGFRRLLGKDNAIESLIAETNLVQPYLAPLDSIYSVMKTKSGVVGSYIQCVGTTMKSWEFDIACEQGHVKAESVKVVTVRGSGDDAKTEEKVFQRTTGVKEEVKAWAESIISGKQNPAQTPELALADLELLEAMLKSGEQDGARYKLQFQHYAL